MDILDTNLSTRTKNALAYNKIHTVDELRKHEHVRRLDNLDGLGKKAQEEVNQLLGFGMGNPQELKEYSFSDIEEALTEQKQKHYLILNYILNKNSHPLPRGADNEGLWKDIQDFESYLSQ